MEIFEQITMVFVVFAILGGMLWVLRNKGMATFKFGGKRLRGGKQLELVERLPLTANHSIHLVRFADHTLLIGVAPGGCTVLERSEVTESTALQIRKSM